MARPEGSRNHTPRMGNRALDQARRSANKWLREHGYEDRIDEDWNVLSQMMNCAMHEFVKQKNLPEDEQDGRVLFAMLKEIAPYTHRKKAPEPPPALKIDTSEDADPAAQILEFIRNHAESERKERIAMDESPVKLN